MKREVYSIESKHLKKEINVSVFGHYGLSLLMFPVFTDSHNEVFENGMIDSLHHAVESGKIRIYSVDSVNFESWLAEDLAPEKRSRRHFQYNNFIEEEIVPFIFDNCGSPVPIITCGAAIGAYHSANIFFRRPDIFLGSISLSGTYNLEHFTRGYFDENCYFNSPVHYMPNLDDVFWMTYLRSRRHIYLMSGSGDDEFPDNIRHISHILNEKEINHHTEIWGEEWDHSPATWKPMLNYLIEKKL